MSDRDLYRGNNRPAFMSTFKGKYQMHFMLPDDPVDRINRLEEIIDDLHNEVAKERQRLIENDPNLFEENTNSTS